jgi:hypothetical protein
MSDQLLDSLKPQTGSKTSSFKIAVISALTPVLVLVVVLLGLRYTQDAGVREILLSVLRTVVLPAVVTAGAVGWKYIDRRGDVSVAKVEALATIEAEKATTSLDDKTKVDRGSTQTEE